MKLFLLILFSLILRASILDGLYITRANYYIKKAEYKKAIREYLKLEEIDDNVKLNIAYCLYKDKKFTQALLILKSITEPNLNKIRYYNIGNILVKLGKLEDALKAYKVSLKFGRDEDTIYNINIISKFKKEYQKRATLKPIRKGENNPDRIFDTGLEDINLTQSIDGLWNRAGNIANSHSSKIDNIDNTITQIGKKAKGAKGRIDNQISFRYWNQKLKKKTLDTLLIPIDEEF